MNFFQVGERYRDLLQAADTITEMKTTASKIRLQNANEKFNKQYFVDAFKCDDSDEQRRAKITSRESFYGIVAQIKILTILLEMTSSLIDDNEFFKATQLFIFSRHISTGLKLDSNKEIMKKFPVAFKQWELIAPFYTTIKQRCLQTLENENLTIDETAKCLSSLVLLENCSMEKLLTILVQTRTKTFLKSIENENYDVVKEKLLSSVKILIKTVELIHECFISFNEGDKGLIELELLKVTEGPTLRLINLKNSGIYQTLPDIISRYKPQFKLNSIKKESIVDSINAWLKSIEGIAQNQLKSLISFVVSIKTIQDIRNMISTVGKPKNWSIMCKELFDIENFDFYMRFYQPLVNERIHTIINISWSNILGELKGDVEKLIEENDHVHRDLRHYIWTEDVQDNPKSLKEALSTNKRSHKLLMKACGYSPSIVELCEKIDMNLELLFSELKQYVCGSSDLLELKKMKNSENADHHKLVQFLRDCSRENIQSLITIVKSALNLKSAENCVLMARLLESFSELCPNLELCFSGHLIMENSFLRDPTQDNEGDEEWRKVKGLLIEESIAFWQLWLATFVEDWKQLSSDDVDEFFMLQDFPCWETVVITEKGENDETVESEIFVPLGVSISIQNWIFNIINSLNRVIPHTLPKSIHSQIVNHLVVRIFEYYEKLTKSEFVNSNQKTAWQFLFDLKVLLLLFVGRENKTMNEKFQQLINHFRSIIDPFDYDVFYKHVSVNIKKCAARLQNTFAILVPNMEYLNGILTNQSVQSTHDKDPNILIMSLASSEHNWFPLLPIINTKEIPQVPISDLEKNKKVKFKMDINYLILVEGKSTRGKIYF